ncbi:GNAT family N-acetyltransferase [Phenylobacterium aquaticum]|uniref:GNAT family N-acetyltransferase n=1 Tax=Phenylobacterium aquaticum TaxID=1763816 RepID=UPI001F5C8752|nr:GNAT family N-acetyltransferase [Phenylobacterium aquaticum]MCI3133034.1 GNAT family N-acetyltransferase [Phenylobacterium aquaticum]
MGNLIETDRLALRELQVGLDEAFVLELLSSRGFIENIGDRGVRDLESARRYILEGPGASYAQNGYGLWRVARREDDTPVGICGLVRRDGLEAPDVGYAFLEETWGRGYAVEAASATLDYARRVLGLGLILAITKPGNQASMRVLEKIGMRFEKMITLPGMTEPSTYFTSAP